MSKLPSSLLSYLRVMAGAWQHDPREDAELLARFAEIGDEEAFKALVCRHGPLVWRSCTRVLESGLDAEDAFQTTFMALARQAGRLRREPLAAWLHRVARRAALRMDVEVRRRRRSERHLPTGMPAKTTAIDRSELYKALDEELVGLPERLRVPLLLHYVEGRSQVEVARLLGCARRTLQKRLIQGETLLRKKLDRRGLTVGVVSVGALLGSIARASAVPACLIGSTVRAALRSLSFPSPLESLVSAALAEGVVKTTGVTNVKLGTVLLGVMLCLAGGGLLAYQTLAKGVAELSQPADKPKTGAELSGTVGTAARVDCYGDPLPQGARARLGTLRLRHPGWVRSVAFSPDGKTVVSGGREGSVCLWEVASGKEIRTLKGHTKEPSAVAFSPDGKTLASGEQVGGAIRLWNTISGKEIRTLKEHQGQVSAVAFSPDGKIVASAEGGDRGTVRLWEAVSGKEIRTLQWPEGGFVVSVAFAPSGRTIAAGGEGGPVRLWEVTSGKEILKLKGHREVARTVAFSPDSKVVASAGDDGMVYLWEASVGKEIRILKGHRGRVCSVTFSPNGQTVASGGWDGTVRLWEVSSGKETSTLKTARGVGDWSVAFSPDGQTIAAGVWNGMVHLWETTTGKPIRSTSTEGHEGWVDSVAFSPGGQIVASGGDDGTVRLWEAANGKPIRTLKGRGGPVYSVAFSPDGKIVASTEQDRAEQNGIMHPREQDGMVQLWEMATGKKIRTLKGHKKNVRSVVFSPDGQTVASAGNDGSVRLWDAACGKEIHILRGHVTGGVGNVQEVLSVAFSPDGKMVASGGRDNRVRLWDAASGKEIRTLGGHQRAVCSVAFSFDGRIVASGGRDRTVCLWETASGKKIDTLQVHEDPEYFTLIVAFSPDGRTLAITNRDCVQLWDLLSGTALPSLAGHRAEVEGAAFSPNGRALVSVSVDSTGLVWNLDYGAARPTTKLAPDAWEILWTDLGSANAARARRAVWTLAATPAQSVPLLRDRLRPVSAEMEKRLARLIADLDANDFRVREKAQRELAEHGADVKPDLHKALEGHPSLEMQRRLEQLLEAPATYAGEVLRNLRAVAVLEQISTPEARKVLKRLEAGVPRFRLTQEAQAALRRLEGTR